MLYQSEWVKGARPVPRPQTAAAVHAQLFMMKVPESGLADGDILELAVLPPFAHVVGAELVKTGDLGAATVNIGLMSGETGEKTNQDGSARTVGTEFFAAQALASEITPLSKASALEIKSVERDRSIGVKITGDIAAGDGKAIGLMLRFAQ